MKSVIRGGALVLTGIIVTGALLPRAVAAEGDMGVPREEIKPLVDKAVVFLKSRQAPDGSFSGKARGMGPGISALVVAGLLRNGYAPDDPLVAQTLKYLEANVQKDGGIYDRALANYVTSVALLAFKEANKDGKYDAVLRNATKFLKSLQYDDSKAGQEDLHFGGVGYDGGGRSRPDVSNTQLFLEALLAAGVPKDDPAVQRALKFMSRCQNLPGETNDQAFAKKTTEEDKGGFVYNPFEADNEKSARRTPVGGLRSEGAMTYAGLKSFLYAGVDKNDLRVKGAVDWIRRHYTVSENIGQGQSGVYYYLHTFAKAMDAWGENPFVDAKGGKHDWRREMFEELKKRQRKDGSWVNDQRDAFGEGNPDLATAFALLALSYAEAPRK